ncbi:MAG: VCBS repeat-containing protein [Gammaproteobacteria bacterium]|nr:VCBS repeat-containing protein [Gammaproteobacteria bacterium]
MAACCLLPTMVAAADDPWFIDVTADSGLRFEHFNGMTGKRLFAEMMGAGGALADFDNDGDLDVYLVQGTRFGHSPDDEHCDQLFLNALVPTGQARFEAGPKLPQAACHYGMGIATGDVDNDGDVDIYLVNFGRNELLLNDGQGRFTSATDTWQANDDRWSVAASFADFDNDGWLDLYIANYTDFSLDNQRECYNEAAELEYCGPNAYKPETDRLLRNDAGKGFIDVTAQMGLAKTSGAGLGVIAADFTGDSRADFFVANDQGLNRLWINHGERFIDDALLAGVAVNMEGKAEASMGVDAADFDADGDIDLFMTHLARETNTLYVNDGNGLFEDRTLSFGLGGSSLPYTGFGTAWRDFDGDGDLDLFVANGAVMRIDAQIAAGDPLPLREPNQVYEKSGDGFRDISAANPAVSGQLTVSRGAIFGDIDNDGDVDVIVTNNNGPAQVLENIAGSDGCWVGIAAYDNALQRDVYGAAVRIAGGNWQVIRSDGSYVAAHDPRRVLRSARCEEDLSVELRWLEGETERFDGVKPRQYHRLIRGTGKQQ